MFLKTRASSPLTQADVDEMKQFLQNRARTRSKVRVRHLSIFADERKLPVVFDVYETRDVILDIDEGTRKLELKGSHNKEDVPLAIYWFDWSDETRESDKSIVILEGGQRFEFTCRYNESGSVTPASVKIVYGEQAKARAFRLALRRCANTVRAGDRKRLSQLIPVGILACLLMICVTVAVKLYYVGQPPELTEQDNTVNADTSKQQADQSSITQASTPPQDGAAAQNKANTSGLIGSTSNPHQKGASTAKKHNPQKQAVPNSAKLETDRSNKSADTSAVDSQLQVALEANLDPVLIEGAKRRTVDLPQPDPRLFEVRVVYIDRESFQDHEFAQTVYDILASPEGLTKVSGLSITPDIKRSDAVLRGSITSNNAGCTIAVRLVNRAGRVIWPHSVFVSGEKSEQVVREAVRQVVEKLQADLKKK